MNECMLSRAAARLVTLAFTTFAIALAATAMTAAVAAAPAPAESAGAAATPPATEQPAASAPESVVPAKVEPSPAAEELQEVIVTARKVEEKSQSTPVAVTAFTSEQLRAREILQPQDLQISTPSLFVAGGATVSGGRNVANYSVRGLSVGGAVYIAGAPSPVLAGVNGAFSGGAEQQQFYDLASAQVVAGPQGTLFGRTSVGGAILFEPRRPTNEFDGYFQDTEGNLNLHKVEGMLNVPIIDNKLALRVAGFILRREGYTTSETTGQKLDDQHRAGVRVGVDFKPISVLDSYTMLQINDINENGVANVVRDYNANYMLQGALPLYNLPSYFAGPVFGGICKAEAARLGVASSDTNAFVNNCANQRVALLTQSGNELATLAARAQKGSVRLTRTSELNSSRTTSYQVINNSVLGLGDFRFLSDAKLKNIFAYSWIGNDFAGFTDLDGTASPLLVIRNSPVGGNVLGTCVTSGPDAGTCSYPPPQPRDTPASTPSQLSEEVNASVKVGRYVDLLAGYFYLKDKVGADRGLDYSAFDNVFNPGLAPGTPAPSAYQRSVERGEFLNGTVDLSDWVLKGLSFTAGFRHSSTASDSGFPSTFGGMVTSTNGTSASGNNRSLTLDWQMNRNMMFYARSGTGFQPGGTNNSCLLAGAPSNCATQYKPQKVVDYEIGSKFDWRLGDLSLRTNSAIYRSNFTDIQKGLIVVINNTPATLTVNSAKAQIQGLELEQTARYKRISVTATYSYTDAKYQKWFADGPGLPCTDPISNSSHDCFDYSGSAFTGTPKNKASLLAKWYVPTPTQWGAIAPSIQYAYRSSVLYGRNLVVDPLSSASGYSLLNARIDWTDMFGLPLDAALFGRNLLNKVYETSVSPLYNNNLFGFNTVQYGEPLNYGIELRYRFGASAK